MQATSQAEVKLTPQEVRQLHHPRSKAIQHSLRTLALGTMDCYSPLEANNLLLSIFQPQAHRLVRTLASVFLQQIPSPRNTRGGLSQDTQNQRKRRSKTAQGKQFFQATSKDQPHHKRHNTTQSFQDNIKDAKLCP